MKKNSAWAVSIAAIGSGLIVAITLLHFIQANRAGLSGGYPAFFAGAIGAGFLAAICHHISVPSEQRGLGKFLFVAIFVAAATATALFVVLITAFGS